MTGAQLCVVLAGGRTRLQRKGEQTMRNMHGSCCRGVNAFQGKVAQRIDNSRNGKHCQCCEETIDQFPKTEALRLWGKNVLTERDTFDWGHAH